MRWIFLVISTFFLFSYSLRAQNIVESPQNISIDEEIEANFKQLYLVFAGPYTASPSSSFGHLFLLVEPKESTSLNPQLWRAINFAADVEGHSGVSTLYNGLLGNLEGSFEQLPFYKKIRDYSYAESRDLWLFPVELNKSEKKRFVEYINNKQDNLAQYRFSDKNCATRISETLHYTLNEEYDKQLFVLPQDVLSNNHIESRLSQPLWIEDIEGQLSDLVSRYGDNGFSKSKVDSLNPTEKVHFLKTYEWLYNNKSVRLDADKKEHIRQLRYEVAQQKADYQFQQLEQRPFKIHGPSRAGFSYVYKNNSQINLLVDARLGLHSFSDIAYTYPKYDYIDVFRFRTLFSTSEVLFDEFWVFLQSSRQPKSEMKTPFSWSLGLGGDRYIYEGESLMAMGIYTAAGNTFSVIDERWTTSLMLSINPTYLEKNTWSLIVNPTIENRIFASRNVKGLLEISNPIFLQSKIAFEPRIKFQGIYSVTNNLYLNSNMEFHVNHLRVLFGINFNFSI